MTAEQLQHARAAAFHQDGHPLLTADDTSNWLRETGLCLLSPRPREVAAPVPTFVEATLGRTEPEPRPDALATALHLLGRLVAQGEAVPLHLLGAAGPGATDHPDFLCTGETLPFVYALRGDREWSRGPRGKSSPLEGEVWKLLGSEGPSSASAVRDRIGRHLTESAALRALGELWADLRVEPVYEDDGETRWQRLELRHEGSMTAGSAMAQGMALSALVSLYLQTAIAATGDEIEAFLSPLASRSRVREAVRGLHATRQLGVRNLGPREHFYVEGSLPAFADGVAATPPDLLPEVPEPTDTVVIGEVVVGEGGAFRIEALSEAETERERTVGEGRKRFVASRGAAAGDRKTYGARPAAGGRPPRGEGRKPFFAREPWKEDRPAAGRGEGDARPGSTRPGTTKNWRPFVPQGEEGGFAESKKPYAPREGGRPPFGGGDRKPFTAREGGDRRSFTPRAGGDRKPFTPREGGRAPFGGGDRKPFTPREGGDRPSYSGDRKPFTPREGGRAPFGGGDRKPFAPHEGGERPSYGGGDRKPFTPREGGDRPYAKPFRKPFEGGEGREQRPFSPRPGPGSGPRTGPGTRPSFGSSFSGGGARPPRRSFSPEGGEGFTPRPGGDREDARPSRGNFPPRREGSFAPRENRERPPFQNREGGGENRPFRARPFPGGDRERTDRERGGYGGPRPGGSSFRPRTDGEGKRPFTPRAGGAGKPFRRPNEESDSPRRTGRPGATTGRFDPEGGRPPRPGAPAGSARPGGKRPRTAPFTSSGKPRSGVGATGRPGPRSSRPGGAPRKPGGGFGKPGAGPRKPGGKGGPKRP